MNYDFPLWRFLWHRRLNFNRFTKNSATSDLTEDVNRCYKDLRTELDFPVGFDSSPIVLDWYLICSQSFIWIMVDLKQNSQKNGKTRGNHLESNIMWK